MVVSWSEDAPREENNGVDVLDLPVSFSFPLSSFSKKGKKGYSCRLTPVCGGV